MPDLTPYLSRIAQHIPHLAAAAADPETTSRQRAVLHLELATWRMALRVAEQDGAIRNDSERSGTAANTSEHERTEASDG